MYRVRRNVNTKHQIRRTLNAIIDSNKSNNVQLSDVYQVLHTDQHLIVRVFWATMFLCCLVTCCYQIFSRFQYYLSIPIVVDSISEVNERGNFPSVIICNLGTEEFAKYLRGLAGGKGCPAIDQLKNFNVSFEDVWMLRNTTKTIKNISFSNDFKVTSKAQLADLMSIFGFCTKIWPDSVKDSPSTMSVTLKSPDFLKHCKYSIPHFFQDEKSNFLDSISPSFEGLWLSATEFHITVQKYVFLKTRKKPCVNVQADDKCKSDEAQAEYKTIFNNMSCRFPFMNLDTYLPTCNTTTKNIYFYQSLFNFNRLFHSKTDLDESKQQKCLRTCKKYMYTVTMNVENSQLYSTTVKLTNIAVRTMVERYAYDLISLLCDVGGNLGLFLGLSCLSIIQLVSNVVGDRRLKTLSKNVLYVKVLVEFDAEINKRQAQKRRRLIDVVSLISLVLCVFQTYDRIAYYFDYPTVISIKLIEDDMVQMPVVVSCSGSTKLSGMIDVIAKRRNESFSNVDMLDILDVPSLDIGNVNDLWMMSSDLVDHKTVWCPQGVFPVKMVSFPTALGNCTKLKPVPQRYVHSKSIARICNSNIYPGSITHFVMSLSDDFNYQALFIYEKSTMIRVSINRQTLIQINTPRSPCVTPQEANQCALKCFNAKMALKNITCSLPFMMSYSLSPCKTSASAKLSRSTYLDVFANTDPISTCGCKLRCKRTIFTPTILQLHPFMEQMSIITYELISNIREIVKEKLSFSIIKLCCTIGSNMGIMLGVSLLSFFVALQHIIHALVSFTTKVVAK